MHHQHLVTHTNAQSSAAGAFANHNTDNGHTQGGHFKEVAGNGFSLTTLFRFQSGTGTGGVYECNNRFIKFLGQFHQAKGLSVTFGVGHAEIAVLPLLGIPALLLANDHVGFTIYLAKSAHNGFVVFHLAVAMQFDKVGGYMFDVIQGIRALRMPADLHLLPASQVAINGFFGLLDFGFQGLNHVGHVQFALFMGFLCLLQLFAEVSNVFFKIKPLGCCHN